MAANRISVPVSAIMPFKILEDKGVFVARCELMKVTGAGMSEQWAIQNLKDSIAGVLEGAIEDGRIDALLSDCGLKARRRAGVVIWEIPPDLAAKYSKDGLLELVITLYPRIEAGKADEYRIDPVIITGMARSHGNSLPH